nr:hypothetical protein CFP56_64203 [Quercus suber]
MLGAVVEEAILRMNLFKPWKMIHARSCGGGSNTKNESVQAMEGQSGLHDRFLARPLVQPSRLSRPSENPIAALCCR